MILSIFSSKRILVKGFSTQLEFKTTIFFDNKNESWTVNLSPVRCDKTVTISLAKLYEVCQSPIMWIKKVESYL